MKALLSTQRFKPVIQYCNTPLELLEVAKTIAECECEFRITVVSPKLYEVEVYGGHSDEEQIGKVLACFDVMNVRVTPSLQPARESEGSRVYQLAL